MSRKGTHFCTKCIILVFVTTLRLISVILKGKISLGTLNWYNISNKLNENDYYDSHVPSSIAHYPKIMSYRLKSETTFCKDFVERRTDN